jgi:tRNA(adenine34) deaminase
VSSAPPPPWLPAYLLDALDMPASVRDALAVPGEPGTNGWAMRAALAEAVRAVAVDEVPVGAVVIHEPTGKLIGRGYNMREHTHDPTTHAEIVAMRPAARRLGRWRLDDCALAVTLEPCAMCAGALVNARIGRVVFGCHDPKAGACGSVASLHAHPQLNHRFPIAIEPLAGACSEILSIFFQRRREARRRRRDA